MSLKTGLRINHLIGLKLNCDDSDWLFVVDDELETLKDKESSF